MLLLVGCLAASFLKKLVQQWPSRNTHCRNKYEILGFLKRSSYNLRLKPVISRFCLCSLSPIHRLSPSSFPADIVNYEFDTKNLVCLVISSLVGVWYLLKKVRLTVVCPSASPAAACEAHPPHFIHEL